MAHKVRYHIFEQSLPGSDEWNYRGAFEAENPDKAIRAWNDRKSLEQTEADVRNVQVIAIAGNNLNKFGVPGVERGTRFF